ncbi:hypothetical protein BU23DRAFT_595640 [Bimuria novae-zelandiae CBS 107.79]|uniref:CFEM domain-containing protein n=1 Tax=Bimuria novae-zelandiae CBS 107.79 TaxID=1447943 RepID=A0A6A5VRX8_9PLEO|nr:hypothetical protein BU23DRAFT_595640 [Bimuria novae-zelandiae CBS 107.79]
MRFFFFALGAAFAAVASTQDLGSIPSCALACFAAAVPASGCSLTDTKCQCTTGQASITKSLTECAPGKCSAEDVAKIAPAVSDICASAGVSLSNLPTAVSATGSATSQTGSARNTASGSATAASASATGSEAPASSTGGAVANGVGMGALALGLAAVFGF